MNKAICLILAAGLVVSGCGDDATTPNTAPTITAGPAAAQSTINESETTIISVTAEDADGDGLTYVWTSSDGTFSGSGSLVVYQPGEVTVQSVQTVTVEVSDGKGGSVTGTVEVTVTPLVVVGEKYRVRLNSLNFVNADCDGIFDSDLEAYWSIQANSESSVRTAGDYITASSGQVVSITTAWAEVDVLYDGTGSISISGTLSDYDDLSSDDLIAVWNFSASTGNVATGDFLVDGGNPEGEGCTVVLGFTIEYLEEVYGAP